VDAFLPFLRGGIRGGTKGWEAPLKNKLSDLNDHLFMQLERLSEDGLSSERIEDEVKRAAAIVSVSDQIVGNARLHLEACKLVAQHGDRFQKHLPMLGGPAKETGQ
jgi:hypothetical protein